MWVVRKYTGWQRRKLLLIQVLVSLVCSSTVSIAVWQGTGLWFIGLLSWLFMMVTCVVVYCKEHYARNRYV